MSSETTLEKGIARIEKLVKRGILHRHDLISEIVCLAFCPGFFDYLARQPADIIEEVRRIASSPAPHPEDCWNPTADYMPMTEDEFDWMERTERLQLFWSGRRLFRLFYPDRPFPAFEPILRVGTVDDLILVGDSVVIFEVYPIFIRQHPVRCISPLGELVVTSVVQDGWLSKSGETMTLSSKTRSYKALFLDANVRSPSQVPPGTEVWVDRSATTEIPPMLGRELL